MFERILPQSLTVILKANVFTILYACLNAKSVRLDYSAGNNSLLSWRDTLSCLSDILLQ